MASIDQSQTWSDWSVARGTDIWLPGWPGLTPGWGMITRCTPAPPTDTGGAAKTKCQYQLQQTNAEINGPNQEPLLTLNCYMVLFVQLFWSGQTLLASKKVSVTWPWLCHSLLSLRLLGLVQDLT